MRLFGHKPKRRQPDLTTDNSARLFFLSQTPNYDCHKRQMADEERASKRQKLSNGDSIVERFSDGLFDSANVSALEKSYAGSKPYQHAVIPALFDRDFLNEARREITECLSFREKETDICSSRVDYWVRAC